MAQNKVEAQAAKIFLKAAAYIRKYGWQKEGMSIHGQPRCSMGALASAHPQQAWSSSLSGLMHGALYEELAGMSLTQFNYKYKSGEKVAQLYERIAGKISQGKTLQRNIA